MLRDSKAVAFLADSRAVFLPPHLALLADAATSLVVRQSDSSSGDGASIVIYVIIAVLLVIGVLLVALAVWLLRVTRPDRELLAPLEHMEGRRWRRLDPQGRRRALDEVRPPGAVPIDRAQSTPTVDREFAATRPVRDFSDLADGATELSGSDANGDGTLASTEPARGADTDGFGNGTEALASDPQPAEHAIEATEATEAPAPDDDASDDDANDDDAFDDDDTVEAERPEANEPVLDRPESDSSGVPITETGDPLVIDTELADPSLLDTPFGAERTGASIESDPGRDRVGAGADTEERSPLGDDTGEFPSEADAEIPLMPGEGLLRRPRSDADRR